MSGIISSLSVQELANDSHFKMYNRQQVILTEGKGSIAKDSTGKEYIDVLAGVAVNSLGHCHPKVVDAIKEQASKLIHVSNIYYNEPQSLLSNELTHLSGMDRVFFCNSGAEANEGAIKLVRKYASRKGRTGVILSMSNCFHGRTLGTVAMGKAKYQNGFGPIPDGFKQIPFNDLAAFESAVATLPVIGIFIEPIQGEGGIYPADRDYLKEVRKICSEKDILLVFDEIQCGIGRSGKMFAWQEFHVKPDILTSAKALGGGFPIGATLARWDVSEAFGFGDHGTTYGGNPLACAAALATIKTIHEEKLAQAASEKGQYIQNKIMQFAQDCPAIKEIRGMGLMIGVQLSFKGAPVIKRMLDKGVLANCASEDTIRLVPPLNISYDQIDTVLEKLIESIKEEQNKHAKA